MKQIVKKYTVKCTEDKCDKFYYARGLCKSHYKILLGREGGYAKDYAKRKDLPGFKKMKSESDLKYRDRLRSEGVLSDMYRKTYLKSISNPENVEKRRERNKDYFLKNKAIVSEKNAAHARRLRDYYKDIVFNHYSNSDIKCANCGIDAYSVLCLDHINNDGAEHKRRLNKQGKKSLGTADIYRDIIRNNFPDNFQVLCFNCNFHKEFMRRCDEQDEKLKKLMV